eukprot:1160445-Pelagomonas_calceolata.AAC.7
MITSKALKHQRGWTAGYGKPLETSQQGGAAERFLNSSSPTISLSGQLGADCPCGNMRGTQ